MVKEDLEKLRSILISALSHTASEDWNIPPDPATQPVSGASLTMGSRGRYPWWDGPRLRGSSGWLLLRPHS